MFPAFSKLLSLTTLFLWAVCITPSLAAGDVSTRVGNRTIERTVNLRTHSIHAPYIDQDLQNRWWDFGADSYVNTNKYIRLTRNVPSQMGWLWSRLALTTGNFVVEAEFKVIIISYYKPALSSLVQISGDSSHLFGDGLALWLTTERTQPGPVFGNKDHFTGLGILIDTYANGRHSYGFPRISGFLSDGSLSYDFGTDGEHQAIGACTANVRRTNVATKLKVTYLKGQFLDVKVQYKAWDDWSDCFHVENITLPTSPFLGFSAMTGEVSDAHDIISVTTSSAILAADDSGSNNIKKSIWRSGSSSSSSSQSTWFGLFFKLFLLCGVGAGGFYGWKEYKRRQRYGGFGGGNFSGGYGGSGGMLGSGPSGYSPYNMNAKRF